MRGGGGVNEKWTIQLLSYNSMSCREWRDITLVLPVDRMLNLEYGAEIGLFFKIQNQLQYHRFTGNFIHVYIIYV